jgi:osmotically-inducible protein OsmY
VTSSAEPTIPLLQTWTTDLEPIKKSDSEIERDVRDELKWDPDLHADDIAVSVKNGVVTLAGFAPSYTDTLEAEAAEAGRRGSRGRELYRGSAARDRSASRSGYCARCGRVPEGGENAVRKVKGVKGVTNVITVKPKVEPSELKRKIQDAFKRNAEVDADRITVEANGSEVTLKGTVRSWIEREEAERVAWSAPGITKVEDRIVVSP